MYCDYQTFRNSYNSYSTKIIGGDVERFMNSKDEDGYKPESCCVHMSYALNRSGLTIGADFDYHSPELYKGRVGANSGIGADGFRYIYGVPAMRVYLKNKFNNTRNFRGDNKKLYESIKGKFGIIALGNRHIDIWNYDKYSLAPRGQIIQNWNSASVAKWGIDFWPLEYISDTRE